MSLPCLVCKALQKNFLYYVDTFKGGILMARQFLYGSAHYSAATAISYHGRGGTHQTRLPLMFACI